MLYHVFTFSTFHFVSLCYIKPYLAALCFIMLYYSFMSHDVSVYYIMHVGESKYKCPLSNTTMTLSLKIVEL